MKTSASIQNQLQLTTEQRLSMIKHVFAEFQYIRPDDAEFLIELAESALKKKL